MLNDNHTNANDWARQTVNTLSDTLAQNRIQDSVQTFNQAPQAPYISAEQQLNAGLFSQSTMQNNSAPATTSSQSNLGGGFGHNAFASSSQVNAFTGEPLQSNTMAGDISALSLDNGDGGGNSFGQSSVGAFNQAPSTFNVPAQAISANPTGINMTPTQWGVVNNPAIRNPIRDILKKTGRWPTIEANVKTVTRNQEFNKNKANIKSYTKIDGNIGYDLYNNNDVLYDVGNNNFSRTLWQEYNQQSLRPYDNFLTGDERIEKLTNGQNLFLDVENNSNANQNMPVYTSFPEGYNYVNKYNDIIEKYAQKYNVDADIVKAIMYNEAATGHKVVLNDLADRYNLSGSQMPMNIRGDTWGDFNGLHYDTYNPEQNIELGVQVIKKLQNSIHNPTIEKVATLYNSTGAMQVNDYGARTKTIYEEKPWNLKFKLR
jgi:hypothetical protein